MTTEPHLAQRLAAVLGEVEKVERDGKNPAFNHRYATKDAMMEEIRPRLAKHGIAALISCDRQWDEGGMVRVEMSLTLTDGADTLVVKGQGAAADKFDKAVFKAQTTCLRYMLGHTFLIPTGDDHVEESERPAPKKAARAPGNASPTPSAAPHTNHSKRIMVAAKAADVDDELRYRLTRMFSGVTSSKDVPADKVSAVVAALKWYQQHPESIRELEKWEEKNGVVAA